MNYVPVLIVVVLSILLKDLYFQNFHGKKNSLQVRITNNSIMICNEAIEGLSIEI